MDHILLTGATGFLGSHLLGALLAQGYRVTILKRSTSDTWRISHLLAQVRAFDVDQAPIEEAFKNRNVDAVIHTACSYGRHGQSLHEVVESNLLFSLKIIDAAVMHKTKVFVNTDTFFNLDSDFSGYLNRYTLSKKQFVEWLKQYSKEIAVINLRLQHVYGPNDNESKFLPWLVSQLAQRVQRIPLTEGNQLRDFIYVDDVVAAYILILKRFGEISGFSEFDVGTGSLTSVRDFIIAIHKEFISVNPDSETELDFGAIAMQKGELLSATTNPSRLLAIGWFPRFTIVDGIRSIL